jgi:hypothetical protein
MKQSLVIKWMKSVILASLATLSLVTLSCGCSASQKQTTDDNTNPEQTTPPDNRIDLATFLTLVYPQNTSSNLKTAVDTFCSKLSDKTSLTQIADSEGRITEGAEIVLKLGAEDDGETHSYSLFFEEEKIVIEGSNSDAVMVGMKIFLKNYLSEDGTRVNAVNGDQYEGTFGDEIRIFPNLVMWELESQTTIEQPPKSSYNATMKYCSLIELNYQTEETLNGVLIATGERYIEEHYCPIYRSTDQGATWETVTLIEDPYHPGMRTTFAPCLFELPMQVGEMPAGTLILGSNTVNNDWNEGYVVLYRSFDGGLTWEGFSVVAGGKAANGQFGVWEPNFVCTDDGTLICFYSDDFDTTCSQTIVYKSSTDGINWSDQVSVVRLTSQTGLRPGMPVVTRLSDGRYLMVYEIVGLSGNPLYCKYTDNPLDWGNTNDMGTLIRSGRKSLAATPWCAFTNSVGEQGMLVLTGWRMASGTSTTGSDIFVSFDSGESWTTVPNFYSYTWSSDNDTWGYSVCTTFSSDGETMYYMVNPQGKRPNTTWFTLMTIKIS